ncbi:MAG: esterase [Frankiales bacterium]|nr:esterase [Frankiales bacterium]
MQDLVVTTPAFLAVLCALVVAGALLAGRSLRRRHRLAGIVTSLAVAALAVAAVADVVNAHYQYVPQVRDVADLAVPGVAYPRVSAAVAADPGRYRGQTGGVVRVALPDGHDGLGVTHALVYLPTAYFRDPGVRLPVVYLLHGSPGAAEDWFRAAHAAAVGGALNQQGTPAVLVAPVMSRGWTDDSECVDGRAAQVESHLLRVVLPAVDSGFAVRSDRGGRVIAGNSAGGYCALNLGLRHRDLFATIVDLSGYTRPTYDKGLAALFGPGLPPEQLRALVRANSPADYVPALGTGPAMRIWFDAGRDDHEVLRQETALVAQLAQHPDVTTRFVTRPGGHTYGVWRGALHDSLAWSLLDLPPATTPASGGPSVEPVDARAAPGS